MRWAMSPDDIRLASDSLRHRGKRQARPQCVREADAYERGIARPGASHPAISGRVTDRLCKSGAAGACELKRAGLA